MTVRFSCSGSGRNGSHLKTGDRPKLGPAAREIGISADEILEQARLSKPSPENDAAILKKAQETLKRCCPTITDMDKKADESKEKKSRPDK